MPNSKKKSSRSPVRQAQITAKQELACDQAAAMDNNSWNEAYSNFVAQLSNDLRYLLDKPTLQVGRRLEVSNSTQPSGGSCHTWDCSGCPPKGATCSSVWGVKQEDIGWDKNFVPYNSLIYTAACCSTDSKGNRDCKQEVVAVINRNPPTGPGYPHLVDPSDSETCPFGGFDPVMAAATFYDAGSTGEAGWAIGCFRYGGFIGRVPELLVKNLHGHPKAQCEAHQHAYIAGGTVAGLVVAGYCGARFFGGSRGSRKPTVMDAGLLEKLKGPASL